MKGKIIGKILIILLAIVMMLPLSVFASSASEAPEIDTTIRDRIDHIIVNQGRTPGEQADYDSLKWQMQLESDFSYIRNYVEEQEKLAAENKSAQATKKSLENVKNSLNVVKDHLPALIALMKDPSIEGDFDSAQMINSVLTLVSDIASCCGPYGQIVAAAADLLDSTITAVMGGEAATSELTQMEDRLNQQLNDIQNQLSDIEEQINGLSNEINESTNKIISEVTTAIDNADAKQYLRTFMLSGEGNFSYNEYKNYIYGALNDNSKSNTAYYSWLKYYIQESSSDDLEKIYYDLLYKSLIDGWDEYKDYIIGTDTGKSIVQYYYDVISENPDLLKDSGMSPKLAAIMFAYDIYETELMVDHLISTCNLYQYTYLLLHGPTDNGKDYVYDRYNANGFVTREQLEWSISEQISLRINEIESQLAYDVAYILNLDDSYIVESKNGDLFEIVNNDPDTYGYVLADQTIYLNRIPEEVCDLFGFDVNDFTYTVSVPTNMDGAFFVYSNADRIEATLYYNEEELDTMSFTVGVNPENFNGGNGTASDPYLIASATQFDYISDGLDKHYRLIDNIDFNGYPSTFTPIGQRINSNGSVVYDEFEGSLDGNGYTISNLNVVGHTNAGLFGIIGETGEVANLKLYNVKVSTNITYAEKSTSKFYAGIIAGKNNGIIKYCEIDNDEPLEAYTVDIYNLKDCLEDGILTDAERDYYEMMMDSPFDFYDIRDLNDYLKGVADPLKPTKTFYAPKYGVFVDVSTNAKKGNRMIFTYVGGISGANNNTIICCSVANTYISASATHDFGGNTTKGNKNELRAGGITGLNSGAIAYSKVADTTVISSSADSIYNPETTVRPYVESWAGGIAAETNSSHNVYEVESNALIAHNAATMYDESGWDRWMGSDRYSHCNSKENIYIPNCTSEELSGLKATESVEAFIAKTERNYEVELECLDTVYEAGSDSFNTENLKCLINGVEKEFEIVDIYGFDAQNEKFNSVPCDVAILFAVEIEGETVYFAQDITITIEANVVTSIEILNLKDSYVKDTFSPEGLVIKYNYAVGNPAYVTINDENISKVKYFGNITTFGKQSIVLLYNGDTVEFEINVICAHGNNFTSSESGYVYDEFLSKAPTCYAIGYDTYVCETCGDEQKFYLRKTEHIPYICEHNYVDNVCTICGAKEATCTEEGNIGKVLCADEKCGTVEDGIFVRTVLIDGQVIPKLNHNYVYVDDDKHACVDEDGKFLLNDDGTYLHSEYHCYTVTESHQLLDLDENGTKEWYIVYTYTCVCKKETGEYYSYISEDENTITDETKELPTIAVSNGYVTSGGKEVVVYVQLINNPDLKSAVFGIRYDRGLELIGDPQTGNLFKNLLVNEKEAIDYGYNFVFANAALVSGDGNLVKLTFKVTDEAEIGEIFNISVVYNKMGKSVDGTPIMGGFSDGEQINVVTRDGYVKVVGKGQLPGDVNDDNIVDLMDAVLLAKFYANSEKYPLFTEDADVDLDRNITPDDIVALLEYLVGGYGTNLLTQDFEIVLNTNGYGEVVLDDLLVSIYGDNNTYEEAGLIDLERQGYKFLGWYDQMVGGNLIDINGDVRYNPNQKKQTLYAQWELNSFSFDIGDATTGEEGTVYYTDDEITIPQNPEKIFNVAFISDLKSHWDDTTGKLIYEFDYWKDVNTGTVYKEASAIIEALQSGHLGAVELVAVFKESSKIKYPDWEKVNGYEQVLWYANLSIDGSLIVDSNDIRDCSTMNIDGKPHYLVYAKHTLIVYDIIIDPDGGTVSGSSVYYEYSVEKPLYLSDVRVSNDGKTLTSWAVYVGDAKYKDFAVGDSIGYLPTAKQDSKVTVKAIWDEKPYKIEYVLNGGILSDSEKITTYRISELDELNLPKPTYSSYSEYNEFIDWYFDKDCLQRFDEDVLKSNPENNGYVVNDTLTLYAKWDICGEYYITDALEGKKITGDRMIVNFSSAPNGTFDFKQQNNGEALTLFVENVSKVYFIGNPNTTYDGLIFSFFAGNNEKSNQMIYFQDFKMIGYLTSSDLSAKLDVTICCLGNNNMLQAPDETSAIVKFASLTFTGSGSMSVTGGNGIDATTAGANGTDGATAIVVDNLTVDMPEGALIVTGGTGGNGAAGSDGKKGSPSYKGHSDRNATGGGKDGGNGTDGGNGGNAGKGGYAYDVSTLIINSGTLTATGGQSGNGGNGGNGGDGGKGQEAGGWGTTAGDGGDGGDGGNGGNTYIVAASDGSENIVENSGTLSRVDGAAGTAGQAGSGGDRGAKGMHCDGANCEQWATGGTDGKKGDPGKPGESGSIIKIS